jgi:hypothetical protein
VAFWDWLSGKDKRAREAKHRAETLRRQREAEAARRQRERQAWFGLHRRNAPPLVADSEDTRHRDLVHTDAAFDDDEMAAFLLGIRVSCRSSWIAAAEWDEASSTLILNLAKNGHDYRFRPTDYNAAVDFARAYSKGHWYWIEWRGHLGHDTPAALEPTDLPNRVTVRRGTYPLRPDEVS